MLVLTRKSQQSVVVGGSDGVEHLLTVTVLEVRGGAVRLGFDGPPQIAVYRSEVLDRVRPPILRRTARAGAGAMAGAWAGGQP